MKDNRRRIIIVLVVLVLLCICCTIVGCYAYRTYGDDLDLLGEGPLFDGPLFGDGIGLNDPSVALPEEPQSDGLLPPLDPDPEAPTPTPEPVETIYIFTPFGKIRIRHGSGMSWIDFIPYVYDSNLQPVEGAEVTASLQYPDGTTQTMSGTTDGLGIAELVFDIFTYGDYLLLIDLITAPVGAYMPEYNFTAQIPINVGSSEGTYAPPMPVIGFYALFNQAMEQGDTDFLYNSLHPAVIDQYGEQMCRDYLASVIGNPIQVYVYDMADFGLWDWPVNSHSVPIPGAYTVNAEIALPNNGGIVEQQTHLAVDPRMMNQLTWLTYCDLVNSE